MVLKLHCMVIIGTRPEAIKMASAGMIDEGFPEYIRWAWTEVAS